MKEKLERISTSCILVTKEKKNVERQGAVYLCINQLIRCAKLRNRILTVGSSICHV
jgi:hypothetical protein